MAEGLAADGAGAVVLVGSYARRDAGPEFDVDVLAVGPRILYGSENRLWDLVGEAMGEGWRRTQSAALGLGDEGFEATCRAALNLYGLAVDNVDDLLDERQRGVVRRARDPTFQLKAEI